jgi:uncharacterized protein YukE
MSWSTDDPGQGSPEGIATLTDLLSTVADDAASAQDRLQKLKDNATDAIWKGTSADAFRDKIDKLPGHLGQLAASYQDAADGFKAYGASVADIKQRAQAAHTEITSAQGAVSSAAHQQAEYVPPDGATSTTNPYDSAVESAKGHLASATNKLNDLADDRRAADSKVKGALKKAHDDGMKNRSWWSHFWEAVAKVLAVVAIVLLVIAVVLVIIAFPEILAAVLAADGLIAAAGAGLAAVSEAAFAGWVGTALVATGWASLGVTGIRALSGDASWKDFAIDAALIAGPGLLLRGARYLGALGSDAGDVTAASSAAADAATATKAVTDDVKAVDDVINAAKKDSDWEKYLARAEKQGKQPWSYDRWSKTWDLNQSRVADANAFRDAQHTDQGIAVSPKGEPGFHNEVKVSTPSGNRVIDTADTATKTGYEYKSGSTPAKEALDQLAKDKDLLDDGWRLEWRVTDKLPSSVRLRLDELKLEYPGRFNYVVSGG